MRQRREAFVLLILLTLGILVVQLSVSVWLYAVKIGFRISDVQLYYRGDGGVEKLPKSFLGQMESVLPHIFVMSTLIFIVAHFLMFIPLRPLYKNFLGLWLATSTLLEIFSGLLTSFVSPNFAILKIFGFINFEASLFIAMFAIILASLRHLQKAESSVT